MGPGGRGRPKDSVVSERWARPATTPGCPAHISERSEVPFVLATDHSGTSWLCISQSAGPSFKAGQAAKAAISLGIGGISIFRIRPNRA